MTKSIAQQRPHSTATRSQSRSNLEWVSPLAHRLHAHDIIVGIHAAIVINQNVSREVRLLDEVHLQVRWRKVRVVIQYESATPVTRPVINDDTFIPRSHRIECSKCESRKKTGHHHKAHKPPNTAASVLVYLHEIPARLRQPREHGHAFPRQPHCSKAVAKSHWKVRD